MNKNGFVTISLIIWLPLVLTLLYTTFWALWFLQSNMAAQNICHKHLLLAQEAIVRSNNQIISLNPKAHWLYFEKKALDVAILTGPPQVKAAAKIRRKFVVLQQKSLRKIQNSIRDKGQYLSRSAFYQYRREFRKMTQSLRLFWKSKSTDVGQLFVQPENSHLKVKLRDIAPIYKRATNHEKKQSMKARWSIPIRSFLPTWINQWVPVHKNWKGECSSHPHKGGFLWEASIGEGKH